MVLFVIERKLKAAAKEIGYEYDKGVLDQLLITLKLEYDLEVTEDTDLTPRIVDTIDDAIDKWKEDTELYMM